MLKDCNLIVLSDDWGRHPFSCQHLIKRFLPDNRVLWVNTIGYRDVQLNLYDLRRAYEKIHGWFEKTDSNKNRTDHEHITVINPVCLPYGRIKAVRLFNAYSIIKSARAASDKLSMSDAVFITTLPTSADFVGKLGEKAAIYYCVDDFTLWPGVDGDLMRTMEEELLRKVDLVVATSDKLRQTRYNNARATQLLTHGVDVDHFRTVSSLKSMNSTHNGSVPIVVYYGLIDERCDLSLLGELARSMSDINFWIIGQWRVDTGTISRLPNVRITGPVSYDALPGYLSSASILILPYVVNELAESINPLKLKEYLATGLPVVATSLPEVLKLNRFLTIADGAEAFKSAIRDALKKKPSLSSELENFLEENSWSSKAYEFSRMIESLLEDM